MGLPIVEEKPISKKDYYISSVVATWEKVAFERLDPLQTASGRERIQRTLALLEHDLSGQKIVDLGCGVGTLGANLTQKGADVTPLDVVEHQKLPNFKQSCLPYIKLPENSFDGVICTDVIAEIDPHLHRLTLSEISMLMKRDGWFLCSTPVDFYSQDACEQFIQLLKTEFEIQVRKKSYHRLYFHIRRCLEAPGRFISAGRSPDYRLRQLQKRGGLSRLWFYINSIYPICYLWAPVKWVFAPLKKRVLNSRSFLLICETVSEVLFGESGLSHIIVLASKKRI